MIMLQPKFKYKAIKYDKQHNELSYAKLLLLLTDKDIEILKIEEDKEHPYPDKNWEMYIFVKNSNWELDTITIKDGWYVWVDEMNLVNSASPEYIKNNYNETE